MKAIMLMMSDSYGVYIPVNFLNDIDHRDWHIDQNDAAIVARGPDDESYWEAWAGILNLAYYEDNGHKYTLHQDGDLWAICPEFMTNEEYSNFFGEMKPAPDNSYEYEVCDNCFIALANDDYSGMEDDEEIATREGLSLLHAKHTHVIADGAEYGFCNTRCECCDGLPANRFRVICIGDI